MGERCQGLAELLGILGVGSPLDGRGIVVEPYEFTDDTVCQPLGLCEGDLGEGWEGITTPIGQWLECRGEGLSFMGLKFSEDLSHQSGLVTERQGGGCCHKGDRVVIGGKNPQTQWKKTGEPKKMPQGGNQK